MQRHTFASQLSDRPIAAGRPDNLWHPVAYDGGERGGNYDGRVKGTSLYTAAALNRGLTMALMAGMAAAALGVRMWRRRARTHP
jgi:hypothetical protein